MHPFLNYCIRMFLLHGALLTMLLFVPSCVSVGPKSKEAPDTYIFEVNFGEPSKDIKVADGPVIVVSAPRAAAGYDKSQMAYMRETGKLEYFSSHRWADAPTRMLQPLLVRTLEDTGSFRAIIMAPSAVKGDVRLDTELVKLRQFFSADGSSQIQLSLRFQIIAGDRVMATKNYEKAVETSAQTPQGGAAAVNRLLEELLPEVAAFVQQALL